MRPPEELTIRGPGSQLARLIARLNDPLAGGWQRNTEAESRWTASGMPAGRDYVFACTAEGHRPAAGLWLGSRGCEGWSVDNVIPHGKRELTEDEARLILADFQSQVLQPACDGLDLRFELTSTRETLETYLSYECLRRLRAFSASANKSLPHPEASQPCADSSSRRTSTEPTSILRSWTGGSSKPVGRRISGNTSCAYEDTRSMLADYDEERLERFLLYQGSPCVARTA